MKLEEAKERCKELVEHNYLEDIFYLRENNHHTKFNKAIENLINKYKEQEKEIKQNRKYWGNKIAEYHKVIELMAEAIHDYEDWTDTVCNIVDCKNTPHCKAETKEQELNCIIDYFRKKAKGE